MPNARTANIWRSGGVMWDKWLLSCTSDAIEALSGYEGSLLRFLGWLYDSNTISASSIRNYLSAVVTAQTRVCISLFLTLLLQLAVVAYHPAYIERKLLANPDLGKERRALPSFVARSIRSADLYRLNDPAFLRHVPAVLVGYIFFERGEVGASLLLSNISVSRQLINIAIALRKNQLRDAHTLSYTRNTNLED